MAQLGYNPAEMVRPGEKWGREGKIVLKQGIVIPWFVGDDLWRITIRDEKATDPKDRYKQVAGGSNGLYLGYLLGYDRPVIIVEGEIDALSIAQEAGHYVSPVATGSTEGAHTARWITALACKDLVLVAFDADDKGDKASKWWLDRLENAHRLRPWWKDANQMLQDGVDLLDDWIVPSIDRIADELLGNPAPVAMPSGDVCHSCGCPFPSFEDWEPENMPDGDFMNFDPVDGEMYCEKCRPDLFEQVRILAQVSYS
jgi:5S rRNA maturation endonuclease (ribonuclease M5)